MALATLDLLALRLLHPGWEFEVTLRWLVARRRGRARNAAYAVYDPDTDFSTVRVQRGISLRVAEEGLGWAIRVLTLIIAVLGATS